MTNKEEQNQQPEGEEKLERVPFMMTIPDGESIPIDFAKHEEDSCILMHATRLDDRKEAKLIIKYDFYKGNVEEMTDEQLKTAEMEPKEEIIKFEKGQKEATLEFTFYDDLNPICEAQGSEISVQGVFAQEFEEEEAYTYEEEEEKAEDEKKE